MVLVQINFQFPREQMGEALVKNAWELAQSINQEKGFISKVWIENPDTQRSGGIYMFEDLDSATAYTTMHQQRMKQMGVENFEVEYFNVNQDLSKLNKGI